MRVAVKDMPSMFVEWTPGSHYGRVFTGSVEVDVFSFAWEKDKADQIDFLDAMRRWMAGD